MKKIEKFLFEMRTKQSSHFEKIVYLDSVYTKYRKTKSYNYDIVSWSYELMCKLTCELVQKIIRVGNYIGPKDEIEQVSLDLGKKVWISTNEPIHVYELEGEYYLLSIPVQKTGRRKYVEEWGMYNCLDDILYEEGFLWKPLTEVMLLQYSIIPWGINLRKVGATGYNIDGYRWYKNHHTELLQKIKDFEAKKTMG